MNSPETFSREQPGAGELKSVRRSGFVSSLGAGFLTLCTAPARGQSLTTVRIGMPPTDSLTPILYGNQSGIFRDAGLDVQIVSGNSGASLAAAVVGGSIEIGLSSLMPLIIGYTRGVRLPIIAGSSIFAAKSPTSEICVLKNSRFQTMGGLNNATVATQALRSLDELAVRALVDKGHGNSATLKLVEIPVRLMGEALEHERADAASISQPNLVLALDSGQLRSLGATFAGIGDGVLIAAYFCAPSYLTQNRGVIDRFTSALNRSRDYTNSHPAETASLLADFTHIEPALVRRMTRVSSAATIDRQKIQIAIDMAAKYKFIERTFNAKDLLA